MDWNEQLAQQLKRNPAMLRSLMQSRDGQALIQLLTQGDRGSGLQQAVRAAAAGDTAQMQEMVQSILASPDGAALLRRISEAVKQ